MKKMPKVKYIDLYEGEFESSDIGSHYDNLSMGLMSISELRAAIEHNNNQFEVDLYSMQNDITTLENGDFITIAHDSGSGAIVIAKNLSAQYSNGLDELQTSRLMLEALGKDGGVLRDKLSEGIKANLDWPPIPATYWLANKYSFGLIMPSAECGAT